MNPSLAIHGKPFAPQEAALPVGFADQGSPIPGAALSTSMNPSLAIPGKPFAPQEAALPVGFADRGSLSPKGWRLGASHPPPHRPAP